MLGFLAFEVRKCFFVRLCEACFVRCETPLCARFCKIRKMLLCLRNAKALCAGLWISDFGGVLLSWRILGRGVAGVLRVFVILS